MVAGRASSAIASSENISLTFSTPGVNNMTDSDNKADNRADGEPETVDKNVLQQKVKDFALNAQQKDTEHDPEELLEENTLLGQQVLDLKANRELRKVFSGRTFGYLWGWTALAFATLWAHAMQWPLSFKLPDGVLYVLAGSTTVNVLGLAAIILTGLFPSNKDKNSKSDN